MTTPFDDVLAGFRLGESETLLRLDSLEDFQRATTALLGQTRRELYIVTPDFEPERYNDITFAEALSAFTRRSRYSDARILIGDPAIALRWGHKIVNLARRLPTKLRIRQLHEEDFDTTGERTEAWIVADDIGLLRRDGREGFKGMLAAKAIPQAQRASQQFSAMWERSREVADFRNLDL
jgi:hypothetical protein